MQHGHGDVITDCDAKNEEACKEQGGARTYDKYAEGSDVSTGMSCRLSGNIFFFLFSN